MKQILSSDNLNRAYLQVVRNKGAEGVDGMKYTELKEHLEKNGEIIKEQLRTTVTDRFVQQAIAQVLTPIYEKQFHDHSYGFRPNRCAQQAIITALDMMNDGYDWIVDIDLEKFFDTVNHDKLMTLIGKTVKDGDVISIIRKFLVSGIMIDDEYKESVIGTPQGGNLSPLLANIMLNELDKEMEQRGLNFVRYADDCIIMVGSEMSARRVMRNLSRFIEEKLGLKVNMTKSKVDKPQGLKYLGFGFYFDTKAHQYKAKPHAKSVAKFKAKMKQLTRRSWGVSNAYKVQKLNELIRGWINYFKIGSMKTLCKELDSRIRYRLRMCIWKHWKTPQNRAKNLIKLGISRKYAWSTAYTGARIAYVCQRGAMNYAVTKERLTRFGLVSMLDYYTERCVTC
jgi:group II intron reverse transcriptase/maturase